jgi:hypothetical protein
MQRDQLRLRADIEDRHWWFVGRRRILCRLVTEVLTPSPKTTILLTSAAEPARTSPLWRATIATARAYWRSCAENNAGCGELFGR